MLGCNVVCTLELKQVYRNFGIKNCLYLGFRANMYTHPGLLKVTEMYILGLLGVHEGPTLAHPTVEGK